MKFNLFWKNLFDLFILISFVLLIDYNKFLVLIFKVKIKTIKLQMADQKDVNFKFYKI